ncbi:hypothetical protein CO178_01330 [candidate division WWE3 bacterium CG_4_9_14_3_um_filter_34_6]|uniref:Fimbrial assembly protein n=1 Tax=candidate division WWE3 bacterium CG_4_9_14_3_um_filter_34_6 TaxID=1975079 RepID=A0A2M7X4K7_UNCKA|nr:MAG: hypothetical protein CO178_01330 [candidate division WWE3 bacterium CG_4_9_14_3_um_filter_34_6]
MTEPFTDINFVPDDLSASRLRQSRKNQANKYSVVIAALILICGVSLFVYNLRQKANITKSRGKISELQTTIDQLKEFGESGYKLGTRLDAVKLILSSRRDFSVLLNEVNLQTPSNIVLNTWKVQEEGILQLSGDSYPSYNPIAVFQKNLQDSDKALFYNVKLESAKLNKESGKVDFSINILLNSPKDVSIAKEVINGEPQQ